MTIPSIQNDLSYYRRIMSKQGRTTGDNLDVTKISVEYETITSDMASLMSMFYAQPTPMLKVLSEATTAFVSTVSEIMSGLSSSPYLRVEFF